MGKLIDSTDPALRDVPILSENSTGDLLGLPPGISVVDEMVLKDGIRRIRANDDRAHDRLCFALNEPVTAAAANFLATQTGRRLELTDPRSAESALRQALAGGPLKSLAIVLPSWDDEGRPSTDLYRRILHVLRLSKEGVGGLCFGLITAATPSALTRLVAKAILQHEITAAYGDAMAAIFNQFDSIERATLPSFEPSGAAGSLLLIDRRHIADQSARQAKNLSWSFLLFKGHGRSYCAVNGHLCGARSLDSPATAPVEKCIQGMNCVGDHFAQIDPRLYDAPVVAIDCCGAGNWASPSWDAGTPSLAFHALSGSPSAVITSDGVTMGQQDDYLDILCALGSASTLGSATAWLNEIRSNAGTELPYVLLGDPEIAAGPERWPDWATELKSRVLPREGEGKSGIDRHAINLPEGPTSAPFYRARLPLEKCAVPTVFFIQTAGGGATPRPVRIFGRPRDGSDVWFGARGRAPITIIIERAAAPKLPAGLLDAALSIDTRLRRNSSALENLRPWIEEAATAIVQIEKRLEQGRRGFLTGNSRDLAASVNTAVAGWQSAHLRGLDHALSAFTIGGLWPFQMWSFYGIENQRSTKACPYCHLPNSLERNYRSFPAGDRWQLECMRCDLIADQPLERDGPLLFLEACDELVYGASITIRLHIDNTRAERHRLGAAGIVIDGQGHATEPVPRLLTVDVPPGAKMTLAVELEIKKPDFVAHRFRLRALLYLDAEWYLLSRPIILRHRAAS